MNVYLSTAHGTENALGNALVGLFKLCQKLLCFLAGGVTVSGTF